MTSQPAGVAPPTLVLLHSPFVGPASWGDLPGCLREQGYAVVVVDVRDDGSPPFATRYVAGVARQVAAAAPPSVVLVAHSGAGPLVPAVAGTQRAAHRPARGYVLLDAVLPRPMPGSRLNLLRAEDPAFAGRLKAHLRGGGAFPQWGAEDLAGDVPDPGDRATLVADLRPRGLEFFTEPLPPPADWPDAPCGYLRTSPTYDTYAAIARQRGWVVSSRDGGHFAGCVDPGGLAADLHAVVSGW